MASDVLASGWAKFLGRDQKQFDMFFDRMLNGFAYHKIVVDKAGKPVDYVFLEVNHAFEKMTGLKRERIIGKKVTEVISSFEKDVADWIDVYGHVALTGEPVQFETYSKPVGKWLRIDAYCPEKGYFAALYEDITKRKKAEEALERQAELVDLSTDAIMVRKFDGTITFWSKGAEKLYGWTSGEAVGQVSHDILKTVFPEPLRDIDFKLKTSGYWTGELRHKTKDGHEVVVQSRWLSEKDEKGGVKNVFELNIDITELKKAEEKTQRQNAVVTGVNKIFQEALSGCTEEELGQICLDVAEEITQSKFGFIDEIKGKGLEDIAISNPGWDACKTIILGGKRQHGTFKIHGIYGRVISDGKGFFTNDPASHPDSIGLPAGHPPLKAFLGVPLIREGKTIGMIAVGNREGGYTNDQLDSLEALAPAVVEAFLRKRAEEALQENEQRWATTLASIGDAVIATDIYGKIMFMNGEAEDLTGWALSEASQKPLKKVFNIVNEQTRLEVENPIERVLREGMVVGLANHTVLIRKDGSEVPIDDSGAPIKDRDGKTTGVVLVFRDITERKKAEEALRKSEEEYSSLFANMIDGFAYCKMIFDENNKPVDFVYLQINDSFERITGLKRENVVGKKVTEAIPGTKEANPELFEIYGRVALTCKKEKFEIFFKPLSMWLAVSVYCPMKGYFAAIFEDITERKQTEESLGKLNRHLRAVSNSNQALMHATDEAKFTQEVCNIIIKDCGYALVWVGFAEHDQAKTVRPIAFAGFDKGYIEALRVTWDEKSQRGRGPTGTVIRTGKPYVCKNMQIDPNFEPWRQEALKKGYTASLVLPLTSFEGETFGALNIYSKESTPFADEEVKLLKELANDFAYGIGMLRLRKKREQAEDALKQSEQRYHGLFSTMSELFHVVELVYNKNGKPIDYRYVEVNPAVERFTGKTREQLVGKSAKEVFGTLEDHWPKIFDKVVKTGVPANFENYGAALDKYYQIHAWKADETRVGVIFTDITERKKAEQAIARQAELIDLSPDAIIVRKLEGTITFWSKGAEKLYGWTKDQAIGQDINTLLMTEYPQPIKEIVKKLKQDGRWSGEIVHTCENGTKLIVQSYWLPKFGSDSKVAEMLESNVDITERTRLQSKLEESAILLEEYANQMEALANQRAEQLKTAERLAAIGATAGMVGHDIRNPLQAIVSDVYLVETELASTPESVEKKNAIESLQEIEKNVEYINKIVSDLQDYTKTLKPVARETDLQKLIDELLAKNGIPENVKVQVKVQKKAGTIMADPDILKRIFGNLVTNAVQAMPKGGKLTIHAYKEAKDSIITVEDTGVGIPEEAKEKLFTPLFTTKSKGQGFGLAVVKRMTEALDGTVTFESQQGKGTKFIIRLPPKVLNGKYTFK